MNPIHQSPATEDPASAPAFCRWTAYLVGVSFFALSLIGTALEVVLGRPGFMARPGTLAAFGVMTLALAAILLGWHRAWARRIREQRPGFRAAGAVVVFSGLYCLANGATLMVGAILSCGSDLTGGDALTPPSTRGIPASHDRGNGGGRRHDREGVGDSARGRVRPRRRVY